MTGRMLGARLPRPSAYVAAAALPFAIAVTLRIVLGEPNPGRGYGVAAGRAAALAFVLPALYPLRRRWMARPLRTAQNWLRVHIVAGALALPLTLLHEGFRRPAGWLGWTMIVAAAWTSGWGWLAVYLQRRLPGRLAAGFDHDVPALAIDGAAARLLADADGIASGGSEAFLGWYQRIARPALLRVRRAWREAFREAAPLPVPEMPAADTARLARIQDCLKQKQDLDTRASIHAVLMSGAAAHVPPGVLLLALIAFHLFAVWSF